MMITNNKKPADVLHLYKAKKIVLLSNSISVADVCDELDAWSAEKIYNDLVANNCSGVDVFEAYLHYYKITGLIYGKAVYFQQKFFPIAKYSKFRKKLYSLECFLNSTYDNNAAKNILAEILSSRLLYSPKKQLKIIIELLALKYEAKVKIDKRKTRKFG